MNAESLSNLLNLHLPLIAQNGYFTALEPTCAHAPGYLIYQDSYCGEKRCLKPRYWSYQVYFFALWVYNLEIVLTRKPPQT